MKSMLDGRQLHAFTILARTGSFTLTAKEAFVSQSAISRSIKALEDALGCQLLERTGKGVVLTNAGERLRLHAEKIMAEMSEAQRSVQSPDHVPLRVGATPGELRNLLPAVLPAFHSRCPKIAAEISLGTAAELTERLLAGELDLAMACGPDENALIDSEPLFEEEIRFVFSPDHPWAAFDGVSGVALEAERLYFCKLADPLYQLFVARLRAQKACFGSIVTAGSPEVLCELAKLGLGVGVIGTLMVHRQLRERSLRSRPLGTAPLMIPTLLQWRRGRELSAPERIFSELCRDTAAQLKEELSLATAQPIAI